MFGIPGAGKSTSSEKLVRGLENYIALSLLDARRVLGKAHHDRNDTIEVSQWLLSRLENAYQEGFGAVVELSGRYAAGRATLYKGASASGALPIVVENVCPLEVAQQRVRTRPPSQDGLIVPTQNSAICAEYVGSHEPITLVEMDEFQASYVIYDSHRNGVDLMHLQPQTAAMTHKIIDILLR